jgi:hypothetical protein
VYHAISINIAPLLIWDQNIKHITLTVILDMDMERFEKKIEILTHILYNNPKSSLLQIIHLPTKLYNFKVCYMFKHINILENMLLSWIKTIKLTNSQS